jgi:tRNA A37 threonylcarbamoyladenosine synthetase subunit TsaC/SUA5/YrdC
MHQRRGAGLRLQRVSGVLHAALSSSNGGCAILCATTTLYGLLCRAMAGNVVEAVVAPGGLMGLPACIRV